ncbi:MAG: hypothetical protein K6A79_03335 [Ruminococcus sp.]|nr:hypothetical protein [Ruminococcus sp.]
MGVSRCKNGHFYDDVKYAECPHCAAGASEYSSRDIEREISRDGTSVGFISAASPDAQEKSPLRSHNIRIVPQKTYLNENDEADKTVAAAPVDRVTGWLVCTAGVLAGKDMRLCSGRNYLYELIGIEGIDKSIEVIYDPVNNKFLLFTGEANVGVNDEPFSGSRKLEPRDRITLSGMELTFIPFCMEDFKW